jgi:DNA-binding CsgD family transcriptional regulator/tetratricopeptide (TPR) repeat protein
VEAGAAPRALVLAGGPGIGKTTLWEAGVASARERGVRVLAARPSGTESWLSFAALVDLCTELDTGVLGDLPPPQRNALEVALLRAEPAAAPPEPRAIALGLLNLLRALARDAPLVVAIDDIPWLDAPSADALAFAARRLTSEPIAFLLARRPGQASVLERELDPMRLQIGPLSLGATRRLLAERLGLSVPRPLLRHIVESTMGNPLFALEVGRTIVEQGLPPAGEDVPVPDAVEDLLSMRVAQLAAPLRRVLLAVALSGEIRVDELAAIGDAAAVEDALDRGLVRLDGDRVRASHPLLAAAARKRARRQERRALHRDLAAVVADEELRALHLARATDQPDDDVAAAIARAAQEAAACGSRQEAVLLSEHALRLTPDDSAERPDRMLTLALHLERAGLLERLTGLLEPAVPGFPTGALRARGWLLLSEGAGPKRVDDLEVYVDRALAEPEIDPELRAYVLARKSELNTASRLARIQDAEAWALEALDLVGADRDVERLALYALGWARALSGRALDDLCERSGVAADASSYLAPSPERIAGQRHVWRGELAAARAILAPLLALADERGEPSSYALLRLHLTELELRAGAWAAARRRLDEWAESSEGDLLIRPMYWRCRALLAAGVGDAEEAETWADEAIARGQETGSRWDWLEAMRARGIAALLVREPQRAAESLGAVWEHTLRERVDEPGVFPAAADLVEALAELGDLDAATQVSERLRAVAEQHEHPWAAASAQRTRAVIELAAPAYDAAAADALSEAAAAYGRLGLEFDRARSLLSLGRAQRRLKQWGVARESLEAAVAAFDAIGSDGWAERARADLERVGGRRPRSSGELTPTERQIADLAASGLANKEIARTLDLAVHTVEVHLSRAYARLGIRSRAQLAARLAELSSVNP